MSQNIQDYQNRAADLSKQPYQPYPGPQVAGFTGDQNAAFNLARQNVGNYQPALQGAMDTYGGLAGFNPMNVSTGQWGQDAASQYMSPYLQSVAQSALGDLANQRGKDLNQLGLNAAKSGAFGGYRQGVEEGELMGNYDRTMANTLSNLYNTGYQNAQNIFTSDQARALAAAQGNQQAGLGAGWLQNAAGQGLAGLAGLTQQLGQGDVNSLQGIGGMQQALNQQSLNTAYQNFQNQQQWPYQQLNFLGGSLSGTPYSTTTSQTQPGPSTASQLLGLGVGGLSLANGFGWI